MINSRINNLKLLEQFYSVLSRDMYKNRDQAWAFCEILREIIYDQRPTKERHIIADALPHNDLHFDSTRILEAIADHIPAIVQLMNTDELFAKELKALLK